MSPTAYDTWMVGLRKDDEELPSIEEQQALLDFLNQKTTAKAAASAYTQVVASAKYPNPDSIWLLLWQAAEEWPETHERLIELLKAISRLPPISREGDEGEDSKLDYWSGLPEFEFGLREYWDGKATKVRFDADPKIHAAFINLTAFNARLFRHEVLDLDVWAVMTLSIALEGDYEGRSHLLDTFIPAAAQYILQTGSAVYKCDKEAIFAGPLLEKAREKGSVGRWGFWKEKFASAQRFEDLKASTQSTAKQAVEAMETIEKESH